MKRVLLVGVATLVAIQAAAAANDMPSKGGEEAGRATAITPTEKRRQQMRKMQAQMAKKAASIIPTTMPIYDPFGGHSGRNLKRADMPLCLEWRGGPRGTLLPGAMRPPPVPMPGVHGMIGVGFNEACGRAEGLLNVSLRAGSFFARGLLYGEGVGAYTAPDGRSVDASSGRLSYGIGAGFVAANGSFLSIDAKRLRRGEIRYPGASADTRRFDVDRYELAGKIAIDASAFNALRLKANWAEIDRINDNFTYRRPAPAPTEVRLNRDVARAHLALDGGSKPLQWTLGLEYALDQRDATRFQGRVLTPQSPNFADAKVATWSVKADAVRAFGKMRRLKAGMRIDVVNASLGGIDITGLTTGGRPTPTPRQLFASTYGYIGDGKAAETNPSAYLRFEQDLSLPGKGQVFASLSYRTRTASPFERYFTSFTPPRAPAVYRTWIGNPALDPERHVMLEIGAGLRRGPWTLAGRVYADRVEDFVLWDRARGQAGITRRDGANIFRNVDAFIGGLEGSVKYSFPNGFWAGVDIWLTYGQNLTDDRAIAQIPPAEAALKLGWKNDKWALESRLRLVAEQNRRDDNFTRGSGADGNGMGVARGDGYAVLDLGATWKRTPNMAVSFGVENVFDTAYTPHIERSDINDPFLFNPMATGRAVWAKTTFRF